jgi:putative CocE/NonD family hydrolase
VSDPTAPVPYLPRPITGEGWRTWLVHDQRFVDGRPDVVTYTGPVLEKSVHIMGAPEADIFMATSGSDTDVVVKVIDIYPDDIPESAGQGGKPSMAGFQLPVGIEIFRGRYVDDFAKPHPLKSGKTYRFRFALPNVNHVFLPGHRIAVQVQSSLFPVYDRNPQTYVPNIFLAKKGDYKKATITVAHGGASPSAVWLPVVP